MQQVLLEPKDPNSQAGFLSKTPHGFSSAITFPYTQTQDQSASTRQRGSFPQKQGLQYLLY